MKELARFFMGLLVAAFMLGGVTANPAIAQEKAKAAKAEKGKAAPPSYQGDPDVYKVIFEDKNFRVIEINRKKGVHDKPHSHPVPSITYNLTDCATRLYSADGKTTDATRKAGTAATTPLVTSSHSAENIGPADCKGLLVERK